jgi:hypothetical protein
MPKSKTIDKLDNNDKGILNYETEKRARIRKFTLSLAHQRSIERLLWLHVDHRVT